MKPAGEGSWLCVGITNNLLHFGEATVQKQYQVSVGFRNTINHRMVEAKRDLKGFSSLASML